MKTECTPRLALLNPRVLIGFALYAAGLVLVFGSMRSAVQAQTTGRWRITGSMATARAGHTATLLPNGQVLVAGGLNSSALASAELYDPATGIWTVTGCMATARIGQTATLLPNAQVLVAGGIYLSPERRVGMAELYDPASGSWTATASLLPARYAHKATLLRNGRVLVSGGDSQYGYLARAQLYKSAPEMLEIQ